MAENPIDDELDLIPANDLQAAQIREIAINGVESLQQTATGMQDNSAAMGRWILASLLAMNSGGAAAVLSASDQVVGPIGPSVISFSIGAVFAVLTGINGLVTGLRAGPIIGNGIELLRLSIFENTILASTKREIRSLGQILRQQMIVSGCLSAASIAAFGLGVFSAVT